ncbi:pentatricopeptide repeat-containing protein At2g04860-like [Malania oleifera]|uniref:pentatricopeptide repeat-containing protein At2g04860-like n=1 Tax=Malania oleifera TaxID=397392 RepID=UPI0025ADF0B1|nr:pentatricopeptide repeat-containing protein At2g04860-like [Malania oleifera]
MVLSLQWRFFSASSLLNLIPPLYFRTISFYQHPINIDSRSLANERPLTSSSVHNSIPSQPTSFLSLLSLCRKMEHLKPLTSLLIVQGLIRDESLVIEFATSCFLLGAPDLALFAFGSIENLSLFLQNVMIRGLCNHGLYEDLLCVYQKCWVSGCPSDNYTFPFVIKACSALCAFWIGKEIHGVILRTGFERYLVTQTALVDLYAKSGHMETARMLFDRIPKPDAVSWNALIAGYSLNGLIEEAFDVFRKIFAIGLKPNTSTLASIVPLCTRAGCLDIGRSLHGFAVKYGNFSDESLMPAFISMYAGGGDLSIAKDLFEFSCGKNVVAWNALISAYTQNQKSFEAFETFRKMFRANTQPNMVTFVSIIPSCENLGSAFVGESLHACLIKNGFDDHLSVMTVLVSMYAKLGDINSAGFLFDHMPTRNLISWNSIISGYVHNGIWDESLAAFGEMQCAGFTPDAISILSMLSACTKLGTILLGKSAHAFSVKNGLDSNLNVSNALLSFYSDCCQLHSSFNLFNRMAMRNTISWNTLISGCVYNGETKNAIALLKQMQQEAVKLDLVTLISILPSYDGDENLVQGMAIHGYAVKTGFDSDITLANALISMYINCDDLVAGKLVFEELPGRDVVSWNAIITGYRYYNLHNEVMVLFGQMIKDNQKPNYITLLNILPACCTQSQGKSIHAQAVRMGIVVEIPLLTSLIFMYARFDNIDLCSLLFEMGEKANISIWNAIISVNVQLKDVQKAVALFCELHQMGIQADQVTVLSLISASVQLTSENFAHSVMAYTICKGFDNDAAVGNALIDLYARCGNISTARKIFEGLLEKNSVSWSVMINGYGLHGDGVAAFALLLQMKDSGIRPDSITYLSALSACSHAGLVEQGRIVFRCMLEDGIIPRIEHYACIVDLLGRSGHLSEAYDITKRLPCTPSISLLESLLGGCRIHGNVDLGEEIGQLLFQLDPGNSVVYVMLYNIYAAAGRWTDANRVRSNMEGRQLRKAPGFSLLKGSDHHDGCLS